MANTFKVGIICGSNRSPRSCDQITAFVSETIKTHLASSPKSPATFTFEQIDIATQALPFFDEPGIPQKIHNPAEYAHEHTRQWSAKISALDAFVFVTPQYNWGIPAGLKNAIDYLFNEWTKKPAMIVSYGGHGGGQAAAALKVVLGGALDMRMTEKNVELTFPSREILVKSVGGKDLGLLEDGSSTWVKEKEDIAGAWDQLADLLLAGGDDGSK